MKTYLIKSQHTVCSDCFLEGETGVTSCYTLNKQIQATSSIRALLEYVHDTLYWDTFTLEDTALAIKEAIEEQSDYIRLDQLVDEENEVPSAIKIEQWEKGECILFNNSVEVYISEIKDLGFEDFRKDYY